MATFTKTHEFMNYLGTGKINLSTDVFKWSLTNTAITAAGTQVLADLTPLTLNGGAFKTATCTFAETAGGSGIWRFSVGADQVWTASGGSIGPFQYVVLWDDTPSPTPTDPLVGFVNYGSPLTLNDTETFTLDVDANFEVFTIS